MSSEESAILVKNHALWAICAICWTLPVNQVEGGASNLRLA